MLELGKTSIVLLISLTMATPATAQFGGLRKKIKPPVKQEAATAPATDGGMVS
jgi:hypothetical protein